METSPVRDYYELLVQKRKEISSFGEIEFLLEWDQMVNMPAKASAQRGVQLSSLSGVIHDLKTAPALGEILSKFDGVDLSELSPKERAVVRDSKRDFKMETAVPRDLAQKLSKLKADAYEAWIQGRTKDDFSIFKPLLQQWVELSRQKATHIDSTRPPYEVLMDAYERGLTCQKLDQVFGEIKRELVPLIEKIKTKPVPNTSFLNHEFDAAAQSKVSFQIAKEMGYDTERGRMDVSVHPFTVNVGAINDVRITSKFLPNDLFMGLASTIHESGHALYEQGLDPKFASLPGGQAVSMGIHESQSLFWERMVGLSPQFWQKFWPLVKEHFPQIPKEITSDEFVAAFNAVEPGFIRVASDELTYPLHIIIRYEIEEGLISGKIQVDDELPKLWVKKMQEYLGVTPTTLKEGILQDIHWSAGYYGYFPTYTLGAIYASQFFKTAMEKIPGLEQQISEGKFAELKKWLNENIHFHGALYPTGDELCKVVTGEELSAKTFVEYLTSKYSKLYNL